MHKIWVKSNPLSTHSCILVDHYVITTRSCPHLRHIRLSSLSKAFLFHRDLYFLCVPYCGLSDGWRSLYCRTNYHIKRVFSNINFATIPLNFLSMLNHRSQLTQSERGTIAPKQHFSSSPSCPPCLVCLWGHSNPKPEGQGEDDGRRHDGAIWKDHARDSSVVQWKRKSRHEWPNFQNRSLQILYTSWLVQTSRSSLGTHQIAPLAVLDGLVVYLLIVGNLRKTRGQRLLAEWLWKDAPISKRTREDNTCPAPTEAKATSTKASWESFMVSKRRSVKSWVELEQHGRSQLWRPKKKWDLFRICEHGVFALSSSRACRVFPPNVLGWPRTKAPRFALNIIFSMSLVEYSYSVN